MEGYGALSRAPKTWDDLYWNHHRALGMVAAYQRVFGGPMPPITLANQHRLLNSAICDILPNLMFGGDRSQLGSLAMTMFELDIYGLITIDDLGVCLSGEGEKILGTPSQCAARVAHAEIRMKALAASLSHCGGADKAGSVEPETFIDTRTAPDVTFREGTIVPHTPCESDEPAHPENWDPDDPAAPGNLTRRPVTSEPEPEGPLR